MLNFLLDSKEAVLILNAAQIRLSAPSAKVRLCLLVCFQLRLGRED